MSEAQELRRVFNYIAATNSIHNTVGTERLAKFLHNRIQELESGNPSPIADDDNVDTAEFVSALVADNQQRHEEFIRRLENFPKQLEWMRKNPYPKWNWREDLKALWAGLKQIWHA
jgi:hypothetical protein